MTAKQQFSQPQNVTEILKNWTPPVIASIFVMLYAGALFGWFKPLSDSALTARLEPIIFVVIGYCFGRLPAQQNEKTLKEEIERQTQRLDAAQHSRETALQEREVLEEKIKNVKTVFAVTARKPSNGNALDYGNVEAVNHSIETAVKILNS